MNQEKIASKIIEKLASNEESIARLYRIYADKFPILSEFWNSLANEEVTHAYWIRNLGLMTKNNQIFIDERRFNTKAIQSYMIYLDKELDRVKNQSIPLIEALSITFYIENSLIESKFFEVFDTDSAELKNTLTKLFEETKAHRNKAKEALDKHKKKNNY